MQPHPDLLMMLARERCAQIQEERARQRRLVVLRQEARRRRVRAGQLDRLGYLLILWACRLQIPYGYVKWCYAKVERRVTGTAECPDSSI
jgi:hypothetical protein